MVQFINDDKGYLQWIKKNTQGFVLNCYRNPTSGYLMLHRADCFTIVKTPSNGKSWTSDYRKICSLDPKELEDWAKQYGTPRGCLRCKPLI